MMHTRQNTLVLFDIDGTLTAPRKKVTTSVLAFLKQLRREVTVGVVGGSDLSKAKEQLGDNYLQIVDFAFAENGLVAYMGGTQLECASLRSHFSDKDIARIVNFCLRHIAGLDIPVKRGTFVEFRDGLINVSPIGRNCNQEERDDFERYDREHGIRPKMIAAMKEELGDLDLTYSIGGQISFDVFPKGWDKTYCLRFVENQGFEEIHFFGDKTAPGGNDHEIFADERTIGHKVTCPEDTVAVCTELFGIIPPLSFDSGSDSGGQDGVVLDKSADSEGGKSDGPRYVNKVL
mmetsp:Transcript_2587/g.6325  ORF Transcript_2587/g.6325 Transcript_2587/m.6325 type:complete len:290 (+) Transcript_2587:3-872(+)